MLLIRLWFSSPIHKPARLHLVVAGGFLSGQHALAIMEPSGVVVVWHFFKPLLERRAIIGSLILRDGAARRGRAA
jgi:hypothetical protein